MASGTNTSLLRKFTVDVDREQVVQGLADVQFDGNWSAALRAIIDLYRGADLEGAAELGERELVPAAVTRWSAAKAPTRRLAGLVAAYVESGYGSVADAFAEIGVPVKVAEGWVKRGRADQDAGRSSVPADLVWALDRAENAVRRGLLEQASGKKDYKFLLSRLFPEQFGERRTTTSTVEHTVQPLVVWEQLELSEQRELVRLLRKGSPAADDPAVSRAQRPVGELLPGDLGEVVDAEWSEKPVVGGDGKPAA